MPAYVPRADGDDDKFKLPNMTEGDSHPYHIIVVCVHSSIADVCND